MKKMSSTNTQNDYSRQQALEYMKEIESVTGEVKKALKDGYDEMVTVYRANWKGVDEQTFEAQMAALITENYKIARTARDNAIIVLNGAIKALMDYQNQLAEGMAGNGVTAQQYDANAFTEYAASDNSDLELTVNNEAITADMKLGLLNANSGTNLEDAGSKLSAKVVAACTKYEDVLDKITVFESSTATDSNLGLKNVRENLQFSMLRISNYINNFNKTKLQQLVDDFGKSAKTLEQSISDDAATIKTNTDKAYEGASDAAQSSAESAASR